MPYHGDFRAREEEHRANRTPSTFAIDRVELADIHDGPCDSDDPNLPEARPARLWDLYSDDEWAAFARRVRAAHLANAMKCKCSIFICLPCYCIMGRIQKNANKQLEAAVEAALAEENERLAKFGLRWWIALPDRPWNGYYRHTWTYKFDLIWVDGARQQWEAVNPRRRRLSAEPYPFALLPRRTQTHIGDMARTRLATIGPSAAATDALQPAAWGYPFGFDMRVLDYFSRGEPPGFDGDAATRMRPDLTPAATVTTTATVIHVAPVDAFPVISKTPPPPPYSSAPI